MEESAASVAVVWYLMYVRALAAQSISQAGVIVHGLMFTAAVKPPSQPWSSLLGVRYLVEES